MSRTIKRSLFAFVTALVLLLTSGVFAMLHAQGREPTYTLTLNANGGYFLNENGKRSNTQELIFNPNPDNSMEVVDFLWLGSAQGAYAPSDDVMFDGWYIDEACTIPLSMDNPGDHYCPDKDTTAYAKWCAPEDAKYFTEIIFDPNGGTFYNGDNKPSKDWIRNGDYINPIVYFNGKKDEYSALWYYDKECTKLANKQISNYKQGTVLYAGANQNAYLTLDANGGYFSTGGEKPTTTTYRFTAGKPLKYSFYPNTNEYAWEDVPLYTDDESLVFDQWYLDKACSKPVDVSAVLPNGTTVYAGWTKAIHVTLHTNLGGFIDIVNNHMVTAKDMTFKAVPDRRMKDQKRIYHPSTEERAYDVGVEYFLDENHSQKIADLDNLVLKDGMDIYFWYYDCIKATLVLNGAYAWGEGRSSSGLPDDMVVDLAKDHTKRGDAIVWLGSSFYDLEKTTLIPRGNRTFAGWYYDSEFTKPVDLRETDFDSDVTFYAKWVEKSKKTKPEPVEPTPTPAPVVKQNGLADSADKNGNWWFYKDGKIDKTHNGVDQNKYGWWRVENGKVNFNAQGIYQNGLGWWKTTNGKVTFKEQGIYQNGFGWWKCKDSKVDFNAQSIYQNQYGWWKTTNGKVTFKENGLFKNQYGTWKVENSKVNFNFNGTYQGKTIKNGKVL